MVFKILGPARARPTLRAPLHEIQDPPLSFPEPGNEATVCTEPPTAQSAAHELRDSETLMLIIDCHTALQQLDTIARCKKKCGLEN